MCKTTLLIGASLNPKRASYHTIQKLVDFDIPVRAIGAKSGIHRGVNIERNLILSKIFHTVTLYVNPKIQVNYYDYILDLNPKRVLFNPGAENPEFQEILEKNNIEVENTCTLVLLSTNQY